MINKKNFRIITILFCIYLNGCQSLKDTFEGKKGNNSDEFLIEKKSPLVLPPNFKKLPEPQNSVEKNNEENLNSKDLLNKIIKIPNDKKNNNELSVEEIILKKIK